MADIKRVSRQRVKDALWDSMCYPTHRRLTITDKRVRQAAKAELRRRGGSL